MELICKDELIKRIQSVVIIPARCCGKSYTAEILNNIMKAIESTPTVEHVPVVHAHWEWEEDHIGTQSIARTICSNCKRSPLGFYWLPVNEIRGLPKHNLCPNCGAKMDGGQDE